MYSYKKSIKSELADELINTYMLRPMAGVIVSTLYNTSVTPNQVTIASILVGFAAAAIYLLGTPTAILIAGLFVTLKDILDSADGQLARAKQQNSRIGRFLDSIGDFIVDAAVFAAIGWILFQQEHSLWMPVLAMLRTARNFFARIVSRLLSNELSSSPKSLHNESRNRRIARRRFTKRSIGNWYFRKSSKLFTAGRIV